MIDRSAYIGGVDGVSSVLAAERLGLAPSGTMPHSLIVVVGDQLGAWRTFDENMPEDVQRIALVDTYLDEKTESVMAAEALGKRLWGVRLDTPKSRRGDLGDIVREVRWELDIRGFGGVKIFVSGGLGEESVAELVKVGVDGFGVGTRISNAPTVDFALDIVEKEGRPVAKRGKFGGKKSVWRCAECSAQLVTPYRIAQPSCPTCGGTMDSMLVPLLRGGEVVAELPPASRIRERVIGQLGRCELHFSSGR